MPQPKFWQKKSLPALALWPLACAYSAISRAHLALRGLRLYRAPVPVISVGNINVGGVGKTPVTAYIAEYLAAQGHQVAILSRGYGGKHTRPHKVTDADTAQDVGDEPAMLHAQFKAKSIQIWVGKNRIASAKRAITAGATALLLDDGFQQRGIHKTVNLVVLDGTQSGRLHLGNGFTLPAGPLRETPQSLHRADALIVMGAPNPNNHIAKITDHPTFHISAHLNPQTITKLKQEKNPITAFAGIGNPNKFFNQLKSAGIPLKNTISLPDHHPYPPKTLQTLTQNPQMHLVCTQKDALKLPPQLRRKITTVGLNLAGEDLANLTTFIHNQLQQNT